MYTWHASPRPRRPIGWLGHESTTTTHRYVEANLEMKEKALARLQEPDTKMSRYQPPDGLTKFLQALQLCTVRPAPVPTGAAVGAKTVHNWALCIRVNSRRTACDDEWPEWVGTRH